MNHIGHGLIDINGKKIIMSYDAVHEFNLKLIKLVDKISESYEDQQFQ